MSQQEQSKTSKIYWTTEHEDFVKQFLLMSSCTETDIFFEKNIYPVLKKLVENIFFTYNLAANDAPIPDQINDAISFVIVKFHKFDPSKGHKAFSYYGTVAKNYLIMQKNKKYKQLLVCDDIENYDELEVDYEQLQKFNDYEVEQLALHTFIQYVGEKFRNEYKNNLDLPTNVYKLLEAIVYIIDSYPKIQIQNKNQFYFIAKEISGLTTKEVTKALIEIRKMYKTIKAEGS